MARLPIHPTLLVLERDRMGGPVIEDVEVVRARRVGIEASTRGAAETPLRAYVERRLRTIGALRQEIADSDRELVATAKADPMARRLTTSTRLSLANEERVSQATELISPTTFQRATSRRPFVFYRVTFTVAADVVV
jgi:hypothetical protein